LLLCVAVHAANIQDRDGAALVLDKQTRAMFPFIVKIFADGGYPVSIPEPSNDTVAAGKFELLYHPLNGGGEVHIFVSRARLGNGKPGWYALLEREEHDPLEGLVERTPS
jgi:hypothetical protein